MTNYLDVTTNAEAIPTVIAAEVLGALSSNMALLGLVNRDFDNKVANEGDTLSITKTGALSVNDKTAGSDVTVQDPTATKISVTLDKHKEVTIGEEDIAKMLSAPALMKQYAQDAAITLLEAIEGDLAALYSGFSQAIDATSGLGEDDFREAQRLLNAAKAPNKGRFAVLHEDAYYEAMGIERIVNQDYARSIGNVTSAAYAGNVYGFDIFLDQNIKAVSGVCKNIFGHRNAMVLVTRPMYKTPLPGVYQAVMSENGIGLRATWSYDPKGLAEVLTLDVLYGVAEMRDNHGIVVSTTEK